ncbi:hypothetical protein [Rhodococcus aetherivorans]|uniref:hypothetical protein n=1 Tax=Rhodococcus aetherivorans TaxID=191292 RepID=UPI00241F3C6C|nr:hypothetical protein [Rhodococcus aetherivorans]WFS11856.1 hypothetical protein P9K37_18855 [Rhodococcus aetherivorans]
MRLTTDTCTTVVAVDNQARRPILLRFAGLVLAMTPTEARTLADQLHDRADTAEETDK